MTENKMGTGTEIGTGTEDWDGRVRMQMRERMLMQVLPQQVRPTKATPTRKASRVV